MFTIASKLGGKKQPLTLNTFMLTEAGDKTLAPEIFRALVGESAPSGKLEKLRTAINDKNTEWHARYRTVDGYNVYGGRSKLSFPVRQEKDAPKITNFDVMQEEMTQRDVKTANRDKRVWAVAKGSDLKVDDSNLPPVRALDSNKPDIKPFLSGEDTIQHVKVPKGMKLQLFADEKQFPELVSPVQMAFDTKGKLWVAAWPSYPELRPTDTVFDKLLVFEDTNNDGKADKVTTFLDGLNCPTGFQFYKDGVLVRPRHQRRRQGRLERARAHGHGLRGFASHRERHLLRARRRDLPQRRRLPPHAGRDCGGSGAQQRRLHLSL